MDDGMMLAIGIFYRITECCNTLKPRVLETLDIAVHMKYWYWSLILVAILNVKNLVTLKLL